MEHPRLHPERTRVAMKKVVNHTAKASLIEFEDGVQIWIPLGQHRIHWGLGKLPDVVDIDTWFYEKRIDIK